MKVLKLNNLPKERHVNGNGFISHRFLLQSDNMGFGIHKTVIPAGIRHMWHYKYHLEACYCISGHGMLTDEHGNVFDIKPDTCYVLDNYDKHYFQAVDDTVLISVFNPPVSGDEVHQEDGSYKPADIDLISLAEKIMSFSNVYDCAEYLKKLNINNYGEL